MQSEWVEIYQLGLELGKYYEYAEAIRTTGTYRNRDVKYYTTADKIIEVGQFIRRQEGGVADNAWRDDYFKNREGKIIKVSYSYVGMTCFREISPFDEQSLNQIVSNVKNLNNDNTKQSGG